MTQCEAAESMLQTVGIGADMMKIAWTVTAAMAETHLQCAAHEHALVARSRVIVGMWYLASSADLLWAFAYFCLGPAADCGALNSCTLKELTRRFGPTTRSWPFTIVALTPPPWHGP